MKQSAFSSGRISALSDGVFAVAMTLLVLDLKLPPLDPLADRSVVTAFVVEQFPRFISWILSYAILCRLWIMHHALLRTGNTRSSSFMTWNFVFLGVIAFIPFPASFISEHQEQALSVFIFSAAYLVAGLALGAMAVACRKQLESAGASKEVRSVSRAVAIVVVTALISCLLALVRPWLGVVVWLVYPFASALDVRIRTPENSPKKNGS